MNNCLRYIAIGLALTIAAPLHAATVLNVVSTPNPNVFPLLVAMARHPDLPLRLVPVGNGKEMDARFAAGDGDALLAMSYTIANEAVKGRIPDLRLTDVTLWRGFAELVVAATAGQDFAALKGKGLLVAGPTTGGQGGGPDLIFQAALKRAGMTAGDFEICYLPVKRAVKMLSAGAPMNSDAACAASYRQPPVGILLVEPAATGLALMTMMPGTRTVERRIDVQKLFTGFTAWPADELPHGGLAVRQAVLDNPQKRAAFEQVRSAYLTAARDLAQAAQGRRIERLRLSRAISQGIAKYYAGYGMELPMPVVMIALSNGELRFHADRTLASIEPELKRFLTEVVSAELPATLISSSTLFGLELP